MKGLILKDLLLVKSNIRTIIVVLFIFLITIFNDASSVTFLFPLFSIIMCLTTFSYDEYNKWDAYAITLTNNRKLVIKSKYVFTIIMLIITSLFAFIINIIVNNINGNLNIEEITSNVLGGLFGILVFISIMYPIIYKFGIEKARIFILVISFAVTFILGYLFKNIDINMSSNGIIKFLDTYLILIIPILSIIIVFISYLISYKFYSKKDF